MCEAGAWIQSLVFLEGGGAEKVQVLGRYKYSDIPLLGWLVVLAGGQNAAALRDPRSIDSSRSSLGDPRKRVEGRGGIAHASTFLGAVTI